MDKIEIDWKEAFFLLAILVLDKKYKDAKEFILKFVYTPRWPTVQLSEMIDDGYGNYVSAYCAQCHQKTMEVVRPGKFQCTECD